MRASNESSEMGGPQNQLGGSHEQLREPSNQLGGLQIQPGGPPSQLGWPQEPAVGRFEPPGGMEENKENGENSPFYRSSSPTGVLPKRRRMSVSEIALIFNLATADSNKLMTKCDVENT